MRLPVYLSLIVILIFNTDTLAQGAKEQYQCTPCGADCDKVAYQASGECRRCHMKLVKKSTVDFHSIEPAKVCDFITDHPNAVLLDVRTREEYEGTANPDYGTLKNAINVPIQELEHRLAELEKYKNAEIIVYCSHSKRSPRASYLLRQNGFTNVTNLAGGMSVMKDDECVVHKR